MDFGNRLAVIRNHFGYTQKEMGERLNMSANAYGKKERSAEPPSEHGIQQIAAIFGLSPGELNSDCELEYYTDAAGKPKVKARKQKAFGFTDFLRSAVNFLSQAIEIIEKRIET